MLTNLLGRMFKGSKPSRRSPQPRQPRFGRLSLMRLEEREVMSSPASIAAPVLSAAMVSQVAPQAPQILNSVLNQTSSILPININSVVTKTVNGVTSLVANASILGKNFQIPLTLSVPSGQTADSTTQILNLHLAPIHLNLLGLKVDTSEICLNISAQSGSGNLLGNLLTDVTHALDGGTSLSNVLGGLSTTQRGTLNSGVTGLLNGALGQLTSPTTALSGASVSSHGNTQILHLSVGPLNLDLLGLQVNLDNCHNGPVTIDITANGGPGKLLGNLLGGLTHLLDSNAATALTNKLDRIAGRIVGLI